MRSWCSPFPQADATSEFLASLGLERWSGPSNAVLDSALLLYEPLDQLLGMASPVDLEDLQNWYVTLAQRKHHSHTIASWRLASIDRQGLVAWLRGEGLCPQGCLEPSPPAPLEAMLTLRLFECNPLLLEAYLDLELKAELAGSTADSNYVQRLQKAASPEALLKAWDQSVRDAAKVEQQCKEAREEAELTLLQLHQVQEELEHYFLLSRDHEQLLEKAVRLQQRSLAILDVLNPA